MKTRIFTTAAMLILATQLIAGTRNVNERDSTMVLAYTSSGFSSTGISAGNRDFNTGMNHTVTADVLEEWIATRETWERMGSETTTGNFHMAAVNLEEWISERESWEQGSDAMKTELIETASLEEWIASRESWEQK